MVVHLLRMQIACIIVLAFLAVVYFTAKREKTILHKLFSLVLISLMVHLIFDCITIYTVNNMDTVPKTVNNLCHRFYLGTMLMTLNLICQYVCCLIHEEINKVTLSKPGRIVRYIMNLYVGIAEVLIFVTPITYVETPQGNYESGIGAKIIFASIAIFISYVIVNVIIHLKDIHPRKRIAITTAIVIEIIASVLTAINYTLLLAGLGMTLMVLAFYITLENPDIKLVEQVRKEKKKAEDANASKSKFISVVSHEMRTPMNAVVGMTELLLNDKPNEKQEKYLKNIQTSGKALVQILNDVLDMSKLEAGKFEIIDSPYSSGQILDDVRMIIENRIGEKPIKLVYDIDENLPDNLIGDALRIRQILINLLNNAVKFTDEGEIRLTIKIVSFNENGYTLRYSVKDTGQGIKEEDLGKLFKAFSQVDTQKNHGKEGTGMGLSISSELISLMGGQLEVASEYGEWTEFFFTINQAEATESQTDNEENDFSGLKGLTALVVDDTEINLEIAKEILEMLDVEADTAENGAEALELLKKKHYDIIFTDYVMPHMSGTEFTSAVRKLEGDYFENVPIIALTGDTSEEARTEFEKAGINDFIEKPISPDRLAALTEKWTKVH
ncbi:MAG: response regulator [Ruminococcus sp.]|nr:response regulator [Ruminococcus sp.]